MKKKVVLDSSKKRSLGLFYVLKNVPAFVFLENLGKYIFFRDLLTFSLFQSSQNYVNLTQQMVEIGNKIKVRQSQNDYFQAGVSFKKWTTNSTLPLWNLRSTCFCSFFGGNGRLFEINLDLQIHKIEATLTMQKT